MSNDKVSAEELEKVNREYLAPSPDRDVDKVVLGFCAEYVVDRLPADRERVLELGLGDQVWTPKLLAKFPHVTSIDGSKALLDTMAESLAGKESADRWTPVLTMFEDYTPERKFDLTLATFVLEHVDDAYRIIERARTHWLEPNGMLAVMVPHALSLHRRLAVTLGLSQYPAQLGETDRRMGHKICFDYMQMEKMLVDAGYSVVERKGMFTKALPNSLLTGCSHNQLKGLFNLGLELPIEYSASIYFLSRVNTE